MILIDDYFKQGLNRFQNSQSNHQYLLIQKSFKQCKLNEYMNIVIESQQLYRCQSCSSWTALFLLRGVIVHPVPIAFSLVMMDTSSQPSVVIFKLLRYLWTLLYPDVMHYWLLITFSCQFIKKLQLEIIFFLEESTLFLACLRFL